MIREVTRNTYDSIIMDEWPRMAAVCDFGINSQDHYEALYYPIRNGEITIEKLEEVLGDGPKITALVRSCPSNPHREIVFVTPYDNMGPE